MQPAEFAKLAKDWSKLPKFRHNLWTNYADAPDVTFLVVSHGKFEVPKSEAETFYRLRTHCTGHHTIAEVAAKSGVPEKQTREMLHALMESGISRPTYRPLAEMTEDEIREVLFAACRIWGEQLAETYIAARIQEGKVPKEVFRGWLLETYHYIRAFPDAVAVAAKHAKGELAEVLTEYARQERGHEAFILKCLVATGFKKEEVLESHPLVSTRLIDLLMREMFADAPASALLLAAVVEAGEMEEGERSEFRLAVSRHYDLPESALLPFEEHVAIDAEFEHGKLAEKYAHLIRFEGEAQVHNVVNRMHDIKHAFDVQSLEIADYYSHMGNYIPRQFVDFFGV
jgi:hypothetical protein